MITSNSISAADNSLPLSISLHPISVAVETEWLDNARRSGAGVPWSNSIFT